MDKVKRFEIELKDNTKSLPVFFPGQEIKGFVHLQTTNEIEHQGIYITFKGKAEGRFNVAKRNYVTRQRYFKFSLELLSPHSPVSPGENSYPFQFKLPAILPPSFKWTDQSGIFYKMEAVLKRKKWKVNRDSKVTLPFEILDNSESEHVSLNPTIENYANLSCLTCATGSIGVKMRVDRTIYFSGESVHFTIELINKSSSQIHEVVLSLVQRATFYCRQTELPHEKVLKIMKQPGVTQGETILWEDKLALNSNLVASGLVSCDIIDLDYFLHVELRVARGQLNLRGQLPIVIKNKCEKKVLPQLELNGYENRAFVLY